MGNMQKIAVGLALVAFVASEPSLAASRKGARAINPPTAMWKYNIYKDAMSDKKSCVANYLPDLRVQMAPDEGIAISMSGSGGVRFFRVRVNDDPVQQGMDMPQADMSDDFLAEPSLTAGIADGSVRRVRVEIQTVLNSLKIIDVNLRDAAPVMRKLQQECSR